MNTASTRFLVPAALVSPTGPADTHLENWVAIQGYFPLEWSYRDADGVSVQANTQGMNAAADGRGSDYQWGLERFLDEARVLARVQHPYVVRIKRYFEAHGTATSSWITRKASR